MIRGAQVYAKETSSSKRQFYSSSLATQFAQIKHSYDSKSQKFTQMSEQNLVLKNELGRFEREVGARQDLGALVREIELSGAVCTFEYV